MKGRIIKNISNDYTIISDNKIYICKPRGKFRLENETPLVGDIVTFEGFGYVEEYNIEEGTTIDTNTRLEVKLRSKYIEEIKEDE